MEHVVDFSYDASEASWQQFLNSLLDIRAATEMGSVTARIRPPARCFAEARRLVRDLDLADCVELIEHEPATKRSAPEKSSPEQSTKASSTEAAAAQAFSRTQPAALRGSSSRWPGLARWLGMAGRASRS